MASYRDNSDAYWPQWGGRDSSYNRRDSSPKKHIIPPVKKDSAETHFQTPHPVHSKPAWKERRESEQNSPWTKYLEENTPKPKPKHKVPQIEDPPRVSSSPQFSDYEFDFFSRKSQGLAAKVNSMLSKATGSEVTFDGAPTNVQFMISTFILDARQYGKSEGNDGKDLADPVCAVDYGGSVVASPVLALHYTQPETLLITRGQAIRADEIHSRIHQQSLEFRLLINPKMPSSERDDILKRFQSDISTYHKYAASLRHPTVDAWLWIDQNTSAFSYFAFNDGTNGQAIYDTFFAEKRAKPQRNMLHVLSIGQEAAATHFADLNGGGYRPCDDETGLMFFDFVMNKWNKKTSPKDEPKKEEPVRAPQIVISSPNFTNKITIPITEKPSTFDDEDDREPEEVNEEYFASPAREYNNSQESIKEFMGGLEVAACINWGNRDVARLLERKPRDSIYEMLEKLPDIEDIPNLTVRSIFTGEILNVQSYVADIKERRDFHMNQNWFRTPPKNRTGVDPIYWSRYVGLVRDLELAQVKENGDPEIFKELHPILPQKDLETILEDASKPMPGRVIIDIYSGKTKETLPSSLGHRWKVLGQYVQNLKRTLNAESLATSEEPLAQFSRDGQEMIPYTPLDLQEPTHIFDKNIFHAPPWHEEYPTDDELELSDFNVDEEYGGKMIDDHGFDDLRDWELTERTGPYDNVDNDDETFTQLDYHSQEDDDRQDSNRRNRYNRW